MNFSQVRAAEDLRIALIAEFEKALESIWIGYGSHESIDTYSLAMKLVDKLDWDEIAEMLDQ